MKEKKREKETPVIRFHLVSVGDVTYTFIYVHVVVRWREIDENPLVSDDCVLFAVQLVFNMTCFS